MTAKRAGSEIGTVPTLTPERDALPSACAHCSSRALEHRPALGRGDVGTLSCLRCGTIAAYLLAPPPAIGAARERRLPADLLAPPEPRPRIRERVVERAAGWARTDDCTDACGPTSGCAPDVHRAAGHRAALAEIAATGRMLVRSGPLALDLRSRVVWVDGRPLDVVGRGADVLLTLAEAAGRALSWHELAVRTWATRRPPVGPDHALAVVVARLRHQLGPLAGRLVVTVRDFGYRLALVEYTGPDRLDTPLGRARRGSSWSRAWPACRDCGTTDRAHKGRGRCWRCYNRLRPPTGRPVGRPRKDATR